jgi:hypothetical protein
VTTQEALLRLQTGGAPPFLLDFVRWAGPRLEPHRDPEAFYVAFQLALLELAQGRTAEGRPLMGSLIRKPLRFYAGMARLAPLVAAAFWGPEFAADVDRAHRAAY